jgi:hypothetical protein
MEISTEKMLSSRVAALAEAIARSSGSLLSSNEFQQLIQEIDAAGAECLYQQAAKQVLSSASLEDSMGCLRVLLCLLTRLPVTKRAHCYKVLAHLFQRCSEQSQRLIYDYLIELSQQSSFRADFDTFVVQVKAFGKFSASSAIRHRFRLFQAMASSHDLNQITLMIRCFIPEVLMALYDNSSNVREAATSLLLQLCSLVHMDETLKTELLVLIMAGLAGDSVDMRSASVLGMGIVLNSLWEGLPIEQKVEIVNTILALRVSGIDSCQIVRSMIRFLRYTLRRLPVSNSGALVSPILHTLAKYYAAEILSNMHARKSLRMPVRRLTAKLGRKLGWESLLQMVPTEHAPLVRYAQRMSNREYNARLKASKSVAASDTDDDEDGLISKLAAGISLGDNVADTKYPKLQLDINQDTTTPTRKQRKSLSDLRQLREDKNQANRKRRHDIVGLSSVPNQRGDCKRKGQQLQPFAYVRLNPSLAKEKHKLSAVNSFSKVISRNKLKKNKRRY